MIRRFTVLAVACSFLPAKAAGQTTLFDNGIPANGASVNSWEYRWGVDFLLAGGATLSGLDVWFVQGDASSGGTVPGGGLPDPGTVFWTILSSAGGSPGAALYIGSGAAVPNGDDAGLAYGFSVDLGSLALSGGEYWLVLYTAAVNTHFTGDAQRGYGQQVWFDAFADGVDPLQPLADPNADLQFRLTGTAGPDAVVPEPITMVLLGSGLVGVAGAARRRRDPVVRG